MIIKFYLFIPMYIPSIVIIILVLLFVDFDLIVAILGLLLGLAIAGGLIWLLFVGIIMLIS